MKYRLSGLAGFLCAAVALVFSLQSCREDTIINANVTPAVDNIHTFGIGPEFGNDTMTILARTVYDDSAITNGSNFLGLGWINQDKLTGNLAGSLFFQVVPPSLRLSLGDVPDSGFIILPYSGFIWGDTTTSSIITYKLYQIEPGDSLLKDSTYYSFSSKRIIPTIIGNGTLAIDRSDGRVVDSVPVLGVKRAPHLRIKLTPAFLQQFTQFLSDTSNTGSFTTFLSRFNGFCIVPDTGGPGFVMPYFQMNASSDLYGRANMVLYKHGATDSSFHSFPFNSAYTGFFNRMTRHYPDADVRNAIFNATASEYLMVQNQPGAAIDLRFPYVKSLPRNAIINKAQIVLTRVTNAFTAGDSQFFPPARIFPIGINDFGSRYSVADRYPLTTNEGLNAIDGTRRTLTIGAVTVTQYIVNVPRELQQAIALQKRELHLRINGTQSFPGAYRLVAGSKTNPTAAYRFALNIVYSKLP